MTTLVFIANALFLAYIIIAIVLLNQIPPSISDTFYLYNKKRNNLGYIFTIWMTIESFLMVIPMVELSSGQWWQFLGFMCPAMIALCGSAPTFMADRLTKRVHFFGAISGVVFGLLWCALMDLRAAIVTLVALLIVIMTVSDATGTWRESRTFWLEIVGFGSIAILLLYFSL